MKEQLIKPGQSVRGLQTMLRIISAYDEAVGPVVPDGIFGSDTLAAVSSFQKRYGLPVTGAVDQTTWEAVVQVYDRALTERGPAAGVLPVLQPGQVIRVGEKNLHLYMMRGMLEALSQVYADAPPCGAAGVHDGASAAAVKWLQTRAGLPESGDIDRSTWRVLAALYRLAVGDGV